MSEGRRFEIRGLLGQGGFGRVYLADLMSLGGFRKQVALKVLDPSVTTNTDAARRLRDEARLLGLLRHRNIVAVDDLVRFEEGWGVVMEYVAGVDLGVLLTDHARRQVPFPPRAAAEIARAIARALDAAYASAPPGGEPLRAIHRDIKPSNVRITPEGEVKVLDFGIARAEFQAREAVTGDSNFGSLAYMSPERVYGDGDTAAGDVYALGVVLWESLLCRPRGRALLREANHDEQVAEMLAAVEHDGLRELIGRMVAYDRGQRPSSAEVAETLRALMPTLPGAELEQVAHGRVGALMVAPGAADLSALVSVQGPTTDSTTMDFGGPGFSVPTAVPGADATATGAHDPTAPPLAPAASPVGAAAPAAPESSPAASPSPPARSRWLGVGAAGLAGAAVVAGLVLWGPFSSDPAAGDVGVAGAAGAPTVVQPAPASPGAAATPALAETTPALAGTAAPAPEAEGGGSPASEAGGTARPAPSEAAPSEAAPSEDATGTTTPAPAAAEARSPEATPRPAARPPSSAEAGTASAPASGAAGPAAAEGERLRAVKFAATGVDRIQARCGDASGSGAGSALVRNLPAGPCTVTVDAGGTTLQARVQVDVPRGYRCAVTDGVLACQ